MMSYVASNKQLFLYCVHPYDCVHVYLCEVSSKTKQICFHQHVILGRFFQNYNCD